MIERSIEEFVASGMGDWSVMGLAWPNDDDLEITLVSTKRVRFKLTCVNVSELVVNLDYGEYVGQSLLFGAHLSKLAQACAFGWNSVHSQTALSRSHVTEYPWRNWCRLEAVSR